MKPKRSKPKKQFTNATLNNKNNRNRPQNRDNKDIKEDCTVKNATTLYRTYMEKGTKYYKIDKHIDAKEEKLLNSSAGEIFLNCIPEDIRIEEIAEVASRIGEIYMLRLKIDSSGASRGFAYLQYLDTSIMPKALKELPNVFGNSYLSMIRVQESRNYSKLVLAKTYHMSRDQVIDQLKELLNFHTLTCIEIFPNYFEYHIGFSSNEDAINARKKMLRSIYKFGDNALILWDKNRIKELKYNDYKTIKDPDQNIEICLLKHTNSQEFYKINNSAVTNNYNYKLNDMRKPMAFKNYPIMGFNSNYSQNYNR